MTNIYIVIKFKFASLLQYLWGLVDVATAVCISSGQTVCCFCFLLGIKSVLFFVQVQGKNCAVSSLKKAVICYFFCAHVAVLSHTYIPLYIYAVALDVYTNMPSVAH